MKRISTSLAELFLSGAAMADTPDIVGVNAEKAGMAWRVEVTLRHADTGWDHHADGWEVIDAQGNRLGYRELLHPHVNEQPFTRALVNLDLPDGTREIFIRARCSVDGWSEDEIRIEVKP